MDDVESRTLWMGAIQPGWSEVFLRTIFRDTLREEVSVKIHRSSVEEDALNFASMNPQVVPYAFPMDRKAPIGYAFIEFRSSAAAKKALETLQNTPIQNTNVVFRLNWAMKNKAKLEALKEATEFSIFVGDLSADVTDTILKNAFQAFFKSCSSANVVIDPKTGHSRSYGFVRFSNRAEGELALQKMQGVVIGKRPIRVGMATEKKNGYSYGSPKQSGVTEKSTVFVGKLSNDVTEDQLKAHFHDCGEIIDVYVPPPQAHKGVGFVTFATNAEASAAIRIKNGTKLGNSKIRTAWGNNHHQHSNSWVSAGSYHSSTSPINMVNLQNQQMYRQPFQMLQPQINYPTPSVTNMLYKQTPNMSQIGSIPMNQVNWSYYNNLGFPNTPNNFSYNMFPQQPNSSY